MNADWRYCRLYQAVRIPVQLCRFCIFSFLLPTAVFSQGVDIRGLISDSTTAEKLPFANVVLVGTNKGAATNISGFYLIPNVSQGEYTISVSSVGFERKTQRIFVGLTGPVVVNISLVPTAVEMAEVVVTESGKRELKEINTSIHILDQKDIKIVPVTVQEDVFRSITILPGIVSTSDVNSHFYVRGGAGDQNLILLDGMKIYNPFHAFGIFSIFDSDIIKTTEVYTGAFPPGYGGRLSSVVSMTTRDGKGTGIGGRANVNFLSTKVQVEGPAFDNYRWFVNVRKSMFERTFTRFLNRSTPLEFYDGFFKATHVSEEGAKLSVQGFYSGDDLVNSNPHEPNYKWRTHAVGGFASGLIQDRLFVTAVAYENYFKGERDAKNSFSITPSVTTIKESGVRAEATYYSDNQDLYFFGFEFSFPSLDYRLVNSFGTPRRLYGSRADATIWARYQTRFGIVKLDGGFHADVGSMFERGADVEDVQPRINSSILLTGDWKVRLSYGRFSQTMITVNNEDDVISIFDAWITIPNNLKAERADHYVLGLDGNILPSLSLSVQTYYKYYSSLVTYNRDKIDARDPDYVNSRGRSYGVEALVRYGIPFVDVYAAYTLGWTIIDANGFEYPPRHDRRHTLNLLGVVHVDRDLDVSLRWEFGSGFPFTQTIGYYDRLLLDNVFDGEYGGETGEPYSVLGEKNSARLPTYHRLDVSLSYRFLVGPLRGTAGVHVINLYDRRNLFYFDRKTGGRINMLSFFPSATLSLEY
ncbi:MAG: TonB-dependent receptor [Ignavibacteriales bacterium]|nr:TonB-dependent receptor [Ignavibacteriales bacterium]